jgi:hypothetical protein
MSSQKNLKTCKTLLCALALLLTFACQKPADKAEPEAPNPTAPALATTVEVTAPPKALRKALNLDPFYKKYYSAKGLPILTSEKVNDYALKEVAYLINIMLDNREDIRKALIKNKVRFVIYAHNEYSYDVPEHKKWIENSKQSIDWWNRRARGFGAQLSNPVSTGGEENILCFEGDPYDQENILIHEFAHTIQDCGLKTIDKTFDKRLRKAFKTAMKSGLWKDKYAATNFREYWAEGVQSYFNNNRKPDHDHNFVDTRKELKEYDRPLHDLCLEVFGTREWTYTKPQTRMFENHLKGYDSEKAPVFEWPDHLKKITIR